MCIDNNREKTGKTVKKTQNRVLFRKEKNPIPHFTYVVSYHMRIPKLQKKIFHGWAQTPFETDKAISERQQLYNIKISKKNFFCWVG